MIISRRKVHLLASIALAIILPIIFIAGLVFRPTYATVTPATDQLVSQSHNSMATAQPHSQHSSYDNPITVFLQQ
ncbi:MAG: hypothetical protein AAFQ76_16625 [Cyanobacteria bacterium J06626_26]